MVLGPVVRKVDSTIHRMAIFFKLSKIVPFLFVQYFKLKFRFIHYEFHIYSFIAFHAFLRRLKKSLYIHLSYNRPLVFHVTIKISKNNNR